MEIAMEHQRILELLKSNPVLQRAARAEEVIWINPNKIRFTEAVKVQELSMKDIDDAEALLIRFAPFIMKCFPETKDKGGIIESELVPIPHMQKYINDFYDSHLNGTLFLKKDSHLAIAGSVKARGGIYEVLKHTENLALEHGLLSHADVKDASGNYDAYMKLADPSSRKFFNKYTVQVGSTGNLGMSIGIMSAAVGFNVIVHMSADAKQWKKNMLRRHGVTVIEYESDYSEAVKNGREQSDANPNSYFVDDENSKDLFLGYAVAAKRLVSQLEDLSIIVDEKHPLFVYIPCGVGGAPGGISFGLKQIFGDNVHCFFIEPVQACCMLVGMASGLNNEISVQDLGLTGLTQADGLAVGRPSGFVSKVMKPHLSGVCTVKDSRLFDYMRDLIATEDIFIEPSSCAAFQGPVLLNRAEETREYLKRYNLIDRMDQAAHIVWATGGSLVPDDIREEYKNTYL